MSTRLNDKIGFMLRMPYIDANKQVILNDHLWVVRLEDAVKNQMVVNELVSNARYVKEYFDDHQAAMLLSLAHWYVSMDQMEQTMRHPQLSQSDVLQMQTYMGPSVLSSQLLGCIQVLVCGGDIPDESYYKEVLSRTKVGFASLHEWNIPFDGVHDSECLGPWSAKSSNALRVKMMFDDGKSLAQLYAQWEQKALRHSVADNCASTSRSSVRQRSL